MSAHEYVEQIKKMINVLVSDLSDKNNILLRIRWVPEQMNICSLAFHYILCSNKQLFHGWIDKPKSSNEKQEQSGIQFLFATNRCTSNCFFH